MAGTRKPAKPENKALTTKSEKREMYLAQIAELEKRAPSPKVEEKIRLLKEGLARV